MNNSSFNNISTQGAVKCLREGWTEEGRADKLVDFTVSFLWFSCQSTITRIHPYLFLLSYASNADWCRLHWQVRFTFHEYNSTKNEAFLYPAISQRSQPKRFLSVCDHCRAVINKKRCTECLDVDLVFLLEGETCTAKVRNVFFLEIVPETKKAQPQEVSLFYWTLTRYLGRCNLDL